MLLYCPSSFGGISDYAHQQAEALGTSGVRVILLCPPDFPHIAQSYEQMRILPLNGRRLPNRLLRIARLVGTILAGYAMLDRQIGITNESQVLMASYSEYLAPMWAWRFRRRRKKGVTFGAVAHDPVRDFVVGPVWWHRHSVSAGYSYLSHVFVHEAINLDTGSKPQVIRTHVIPHGPYPFPDANESRESVRASLGIPPDVPLFLSFGHLRNGKNLNLILEAMRGVPEAWLLVAGTEAGGGNTTSAEYQAMARETGVADRCRWVIGFASAEEVANHFLAADFALLTYQATFRSASGVLNVAVRYRRPVVASCGESNLASSVDRYRLGVRVKADDSGEIRRGMRSVLEQPVAPRWDDYNQENSWQRNAELVLDAMAEPGR